MRYARLRKAMAKDNVDVLLIAGKGHGWTGRGYFRWMTDFHLWGHDGLILFPLEGEPMLTMTSAGVASMVGKNPGWITDCHGDWDITPRIVEELKARKLDKARIGVAGYEFILGAGAHQVLVDGLPEADLFNADLLMNRVRAIRSPLEIQQYKELWAMSRAAMERFVTYLEPGMTELQASAESVRYIHEHGARDYLIFVNGNIPSERIVDWDGILGYHMEICNQSSHYNELTVTLAFREPTGDELKLMDTELLAYEEIRKLAKPGVKMATLYAEWKSMLEDAGFAFNDSKAHHYEFHGQGMDWIEWPNFSPNDPERHDVELEEGMVLNYHPAPTLKQNIKKTGINDQILITKDGAVRLSGDWDMRWRVVE